MRYIVPINSINAVLVTKCFVRYVFKLYRLPNCYVVRSLVPIDTI